MKKEEIEKHKMAARKLELIKDRAFEFIKRSLGKVSEYDVQKFIVSEFKKENLITEKRYPIQIVAVNKNSSIVHYFPQQQSSKIIKKDSLVLIDIWARLKEVGSPFADITWVGYTGKAIPEEIERIFNKVIKARNSALNFIRENLRKKKLPKTKAVDRAIRDYFRKSSMEKYFLHGLGHSLGIKECHGKYFRFGKKSQTRLKKNIPFTIEPGLYFKDKFGIRSEIDCYVTDDYRLVVTTKIQNKIIKI